MSTTKIARKYENDVLIDEIRSYLLSRKFSRYNADAISLSLCACGQSRSSKVVSWAEIGTKRVNTRAPTHYACAH